MKNTRRLLTGMAAMVRAAASAVSAVGVAEEMEWPDAYSHATDASSKEVLSGEQLDEALQFLMDSSHFIGTSTVPRRTMATSPSAGDGLSIPVALPSVNGRGYRGSYYDPWTRSVNWLSTNPNGGINSSVRILLGLHRAEHRSDHRKQRGSGLREIRQVADDRVMSPGQTVDNYIRNGRGSFYIDASLASNYGIDPAWEYRNILMVEVELDHYVPRACTPQEYYDGEPPTTSSWLLAGRMACAGKLEG